MRGGHASQEMFEHIRAQLDGRLKDLTDDDVLYIRSDEGSKDHVFIIVCSTVFEVWHVDIATRGFGSSSLIRASRLDTRHELSAALTSFTLGGVRALGCFLVAHNGLILPRIHERSL